MAGLYAPLPTLRSNPRGALRTDRGRRGLLLLHRSGLSPHTPCRSPGALRGRDGHCWPPPAQIRTCPIKASGSYLGCLTSNVRGPTPGSHEPGSASGACFVGPRFPWSPALAPPTPPPVARLCSSASSLLCRRQTSLDRASAASAPHLPATDHPATTAPVADPEISRFPRKERPYMPGSKTTPGLAGARNDAPASVAFRGVNNVGTRVSNAFAAQWLAYTLPYRRFAVILAEDGARIGGDVGCYSFIAVDSHHILLAGLPAHSLALRPAHSRGHQFVTR